MRLRQILSLCAAAFIAGCAKDAKVTTVKPRLTGPIPAASENRQAREEIQRAALEAHGNPLRALDTLAGSLEVSTRQLERNPADVVARQNYNYAVGRMVSLIGRRHIMPWKAPIALGSHTLAWQAHPKAVWNPAVYELTPTDELKISGADFDVRETKEGLGAPVVAKRVADQVHELAPTPHFYYAATVVAQFEGKRCVLRIEDPMESETVMMGGHTYPLAAGYTSPLAMMLVEMQPEKLGVSRLLHPAEYASTTRIARLEPFDPNKTVVLIVHGLMSSPSTWFPLINHLRADEDIRRNYQFWFYSYPSGYPYPYSAAVLRKELDAAEKLYPQRKKMVVIGHSMGSCISRLLITDSGAKICDQMFSVPPQQMDISEEHKHILTECTIFNHRPEIGRVIFVSGPHRGADLASNWMGRIGASLIQTPKALFGNGLDMLRFERNVPGIRHLRRFPDSIDTLDPENDFVRAINTVPITKGIPYHSIMGDRGRGDTPNSSDGVVPYWSSHLAGATSEKIVPSHHPAHQHPQGIAEIHRILKLHASSSK